MSRFRKALAAAAMAVAAVGGGLLVTGAGAAPAYAATQMPALGGHSGDHVVATITFQRAAAPASGSASGPNVILPCAVHSPGPAATAGAAPAYGGDDTCDSGVITCDVITHEPTLLYSRNGETIDFFADTWCSDEVPQIRMGQDVIHSTPIDPNNPLTDSRTVNDTNHDFTSNSAACQPGQYAVNASARIVPPDGYVVQGALHDTSVTITFAASDCPSGSGGGGGGGGGCATATPPASAQPATRRPDLIVCQ
jgi:hypothetical protein